MLESWNRVSPLEGRCHQVTKLTAGDGQERTDLDAPEITTTKLGAVSPFSYSPI